MCRTPAATCRSHAAKCRSHAAKCRCRSAPSQKHYASVQSNCYTPRDQMDEHLLADDQLMMTRERAHVHGHTLTDTPQSLSRHTTSGTRDIVSSAPSIQTSTSGIARFAALIRLSTPPPLAT